MSDETDKITRQDFLDALDYLRVGRHDGLLQTRVECILEKYFGQIMNKS